MFPGPTARQSMSIRMVRGMSADLTPIAATGRGSRAVGRTITAIRPTATTTRIAARKRGSRSRLARRGRSSEVLIPTTPPSAVQLAAAMAEKPLWLRSTLGSQPPRPWAMKNTPIPKARIARTSASARRSRTPPAETPCPLPSTTGGSCRETTSHTATATTMAPVSITTVALQDPVSGISTELESTRVAIPPRAGAVL